MRTNLDAAVTRDSTDLAMSVLANNLQPAADETMESASAAMTASAHPAK
ncbi:hypothetical protein NHF46_00840 [Arthrobacter alpinus]|nr:hypothetical protein [Arthrobacter alpinus]